MKNIREFFMCCLFIAVTVTEALFEGEKNEKIKTFAVV
jgi:hypothetical protein